MRKPVALLVTAPLESWEEPSLTCRAARCRSGLYNQTRSHPRCMRLSLHCCNPALSPHPPPPVPPPLYRSLTAQHVPKSAAAKRGVKPLC